MSTYCFGCRRRLGIQRGEPRAFHSQLYPTRAMDTDEEVAESATAARPVLRDVDKMSVIWR